MLVKQFYNKNQFIIENEKNMYLQSYNSIIAKISGNGTLWLGKDWNYSKTTLKYLYKFIEENKNKLNDCLHDNFRSLQNINNKKKYIQKLIDNGMINIITL